MGEARRQKQAGAAPEHCAQCGYDGSAYDRAFPCPGCKLIGVVCRFERGHGGDCQEISDYENRRLCGGRLADGGLCDLTHGHPGAHR